MQRSSQIEFPEKSSKEKLMDALRYLSRIGISATTPKLLEKNGVDTLTEGDLIQRGFLRVEAETPSHRIYAVNLDRVTEYLNQHQPKIKRGGR